MGPKSHKKILAYDLGGTKVLVGVVTHQGKVLEDLRVPIAAEKGRTAVVKQLADLGKAFLEKHPDIKKIGISSAGPLDPKTGTLLDPTNMGKLGQFPLAKLLSAKLKLPVAIENDAAAAILAEHWKGKAKGVKNAMILTLGTGVGTGIIANGELVRAGRHLHTEASHIIIRQGDKSAPCGCGNLGCTEAFLSGRSFARRNRIRFARPEMTAQDIAELARQGDPRALAAFEEYAELMAIAVHNYCVIYCPELFVFTGSFAETADLFLPQVREHLKKLLKRRRKGIDLYPKLVVSSLENRAGLLGGAYVALNY
ncbi:MAG: ROK family protein [Bdellovibrionia bacterium]